jgi:hypothetical protein
MKFNIGDHLQEIGSTAHGIVNTIQERLKPDERENWYKIKNDELGLINHWVPESKLELHKQTLRDRKLKELGIWN